MNNSEFISGDNADNQIEIIEIIGNEDGTISVFGKNGTTVNGQTDPVVIPGGEISSATNGVRASYDAGLRANVGRGNDSVLIEGVEFNRNYSRRQASGLVFEAIPLNWRQFLQIHQFTS